LWIIVVLLLSIYATKNPENCFATSKESKVVKLNLILLAMTAVGQGTVEDDRVGWWLQKITELEEGFA
jgi:hypothetical protein